MTEAGLAARRAVASTMTVERLRALRRAPKRDALDISMMREQFQAGLLTCIGSGLHVFNPDHAPQAELLWEFYCDLAITLNTPSDENTGKAAESCKKLATALEEGMSAMGP